MKQTSYEDWVKKAESQHTFEVSKEWIRDVYMLPNKTIVYHETYIPRHWGKTQREQTIVELCVKDTKENKA